MLTNIEKKSLLKVLLTGACGAIISLAVLSAPVTAGTVSSQGGSIATLTSSATSLTPGNCLYSIQLASDPALRAAFAAKVASFNNSAAAGIDEDEIYRTDIDAGVSFNSPSSSIDPLSNDCLSCHDGVMAQNFNVRIKNNPADRVMSLETIVGGHPVGMEYDKYVSVNGREYRSEVKFSGNMIFAEGKVGCLTCHNPLNSSKGHLVMQNERSELCFSCHSK